MTTLTRSPLVLAQLSSSLSDIYTPPADNQAYLHNFTYFNDGAGTETVRLTIHNGSVEYPVGEFALLAGKGVREFVGSEGVILGDGWKLRGQTTTGTTVTISISGTLEEIV